MAGIESEEEATDKKGHPEKVTHPGCVCSERCATFSVWPKKVIIDPDIRDLSIGHVIDDARHSPGLNS